MGGLLRWEDSYLHSGVRAYSRDRVNDGAGVLIDSDVTGKVCGNGQGYLAGLGNG